MSLATFVLFYLMTVFALSWGTTALGYNREKFLVMQLVRHRALRADDSGQREFWQSVDDVAHFSGSPWRSLFLVWLWRHMFVAGTRAPWS